uniref:Dirigent protein n=1 Tax=Leersia perrieri TaxID=77586 RepID=A0A0D9WM43_9ORYZ
MAYSTLRSSLVCVVVLLLLMSTVNSRGEPDHDDHIQLGITGRRMLVVAGRNTAGEPTAATTTVVIGGMPLSDWPAAAAMPYSESKRSSPGGPDPQHH